MYACPRREKSVKSTSGLTKYVNACKIPIILPSCQLSTPAPILEYNTTNHSNLPLDNFEKNISLGAPNNKEEEIRPADIISNNNKNSRPTDIDKQKPITPNLIPQNGLPRELSRNFKEVTFIES